MENRVKISGFIFLDWVVIGLGNGNLTKVIMEALLIGGDSLQD